jgi:hypothetical protein
MSTATAVAAAVALATEEARGCFDRFEDQTHFGPVRAWSDRFTFGGLPPLCPAGDGPVECGQRAVAETGTRRLWHELCAWRSEHMADTTASPDPEEVLSPR